MPLLRPELIGSERCIRAFGKVFWAFLFFIDLRIGVNNVKVDVIPDFVGWLLIVLALGEILALHSDVRSTRVLALITMVLSLFDLVHIQKAAAGRAA